MPSIASLMPAIPYNVHLYTGGWGGGHEFEISSSTPTYTTMARKIAETDENDTSIFKLNLLIINKQLLPEVNVELVRVHPHSSAEIIL